jgi:hypothetical protein
MKPYFILSLLLFASDCINSQTFTDSNLPIIVVTTPVGQSIVDEPRSTCHMGVIDNGPGIRNYLTDPFTNYDGNIAIEIRGSTSQQYPKKSYGFETQNSLGFNLPVALLGMPMENDWILYGPYPDKTLIRNVLTFDLARKMGNYASDTRYCELIIDNDYRGIYIMMERIKIDGDRVNIGKLHTPNLWDDTLTGGYIVKVDKLTGEVGYTWTSNYNNEVVFQFHDPEYDEISSLQASYMENFINEFEAALNGPFFADATLGYHNYINPTSFHDFFILQELGRTVDGYRSSSFLHKDKDGFSWNAKLVAGPMWDFNLSFGNADYCNADQTTGWQYNFDQICGNFSTSIPFWWEKLQEDPVYANGLRCRWEQLRQGPLHTDNINSFIDSVANYIEEGRIRNFQRWPIIGVYVNWNGFVGQTYQEDLNYLKTYMENRSIWIDNNLPSFCNLEIPQHKHIPEYHRAWPNPFNNNISIGFSTFSAGDVVIEITDVFGRIIRKVNLGAKQPGTHAVSFSELNLESGNYLYIIRQDRSILHSGKMVKI